MTTTPVKEYQVVESSLNKNTTATPAPTIELTQSQRRANRIYWSFLFAD